MPTFADMSRDTKMQRAGMIRKRLLARGLDPRSNGYARAFYAAMHKAR